MIYRLGNSFLINDNSKNFEKYLFFFKNLEYDNILFFLDPDFADDDIFMFNIETLAKFFNVDFSLFLMTSEKILIKYAFKNIKFFNIMFAVDTRQCKMISSKQPMCRVDFIAKFSKGKKIFNNKNDAFSTLIECTKLRKKNDTNFAHAKKIELPKAIIEHYANKNTLVIDFFGGSGSTLIASELLGVQCVCFEILNENCDIIRTEYARRMSENKRCVSFDYKLKNHTKQVQINYGFDFS